MKLCVLIIFLIICSIVDLKQKKIPVYLLCIGVCMGLIYTIVQIYTNEKQMIELILSLLPGLAIIIVCKISKGSIGMADGIILMITGLFLMPYRNLLMIILAFFASFFVSCIILIIKKVKKSFKIPFIPFILFSTIMVGVI